MIKLLLPDQVIKLDETKLEYYFTEEDFQKLLAVVNETSYNFYNIELQKQRDIAEHLLAQIRELQSDNINESFKIQKKAYKESKRQTEILEKLVNHYINKTAIPQDLSSWDDD